MAARKKRVLTPEEQLEAALVPKAEWPYEVPDNWCWVRLGNAAQYINGRAFKPAEWEDKGRVIIRIQNLTESTTIVNRTTRTYEEKYLVRDGDLLFAWSASLGAHFWNGEDGWLNQHIFKVIPRKGVDKHFLYYYLVNVIDQLYAKTHGSGMVHITLKPFKATPMPLPPLHEQRRITSRIEWLFAKLDDAEAKLREVIDSSEQRRVGILRDALNGSITESWRKHYGIERLATWRECKLIDALRGKPRNGYSPKPVDYKTPVKNLVLTAVTSGTFKPEYFKYIDEEIPDDSHLWLMPGDILLQRSNSLEKVGTSALYTGGPREFIYPDLMMKLQVNDAVYAPFIAYQLKTFDVMKYLRSNATGTAGNMPKVNQTAVSNIPIVLPSYQEQVEIAKSLDLLLSKEMALVDAVSVVLDDLKRMRIVVLSKALRGELGTNDPDEPSSKGLLASILSGNARK